MLKDADDQWVKNLDKLQHIARDFYMQLFSAEPIHPQL